MGEAIGKCHFYGDNHFDPKQWETVILHNNEAQNVANVLECTQDVYLGIKATLETNCSQYIACSQRFDVSQQCLNYAMTCSNDVGSWLVETHKGLQGFKRETETKIATDPLAAGNFLLDSIAHYVALNSVGTLQDEQAGCFAKAIASADILLTLSAVGKAITFAKGSVLTTSARKVTIVKNSATQGQGKWAITLIHGQKAWVINARDLWKSIRSLKTHRQEIVRSFGVELEQLFYRQTLKSGAQQTVSITALTIIEQLRKKPDLWKAFKHALGFDGTRQSLETILTGLTSDKLQKIATSLNDKQPIKDFEVRIDEDGEGDILIVMTLLEKDDLTIKGFYKIEEDKLSLVALEVCKAQKLAKSARVAIDTFDEVTDPQIPDQAMVFYNKGSRLYEAGQFRQAIAEFKKALAIYPQLDDAENYLGLCYESLGPETYEKSLEHFNKAIAISESSHFYVSRGGLYLRMKKLELAKNDFEKALSIIDQESFVNPQDKKTTKGYAVAGLSHVAKGYYEKAEFSQAIACLEKARIYTPNDQDLIINLAIIYNNRAVAALNQNNYKKAKADLEKSTKLNPTDRQTWLNLAIAYTALGQAQNAQNAKSKAARLK